MKIINRVKSIMTLQRTKIVPKRWAFTSFDGHYSDSPKYLSEKLHQLDPSIEIVWIVHSQYLEILPSYVVGVEHGTDEANRKLASAEVIVDNVYGGRSLSIFGSRHLNVLKAKAFRKCFYKKGQRIYTTWHGTPLKKMGRDQIGNDITGFECCNIKMLLGNQFTLDIMKHLTFEKIPMSVLGTPRNDILFQNSPQLIKARLGLPSDKRIILFAPTFRNDGKDVEGKNVDRSGLDQLKMIDFDRLFESLHTKYGGEWAIVCRFHYHVAEMVDWSGLNEKYHGRIINGNLHDDMAEYLACTDILLTDASSCMFDYIITDKPCFLFFPDIENYGNKERGFYLSIDQLPFQVAVTFDDLIYVIEKFDKEQYLRSITELKKKLGYYEDGRASERILEWIFKDAGY